MKRFAGLVFLLLAACDYETNVNIDECCEDCEESPDASPGPDSGPEVDGSDAGVDADILDAGPDAETFCDPNDDPCCPCDPDNPSQWCSPNYNTFHVDAGPDTPDAGYTGTCHAWYIDGGV
jgi:hypothetical protein